MAAPEANAPQDFLIMKISNEVEPESIQRAFGDLAITIDELPNIRNDNNLNNPNARLIDGYAEAMSELAGMGIFEPYVGEAVPFSGTYAELEARIRVMNPHIHPPRITELMTKLRDPENNQARLDMGFGGFLIVMKVGFGKIERIGKRAQQQSAAEVALFRGTAAGPGAGAGAGAPVVPRVLPSGIGAKIASYLVGGKRRKTARRKVNRRKSRRTRRS